MFVNAKLLFAVLAFDALVAASEDANNAFAQVKHVSRGFGFGAPAPAFKTGSYPFAKRDEVATVTVTITDCDSRPSTPVEAPDTSAETSVATTVVTKVPSTPSEGTESVPAIPSETSPLSAESSSVGTTESIGTGVTSTDEESTAIETATKSTAVGTTMVPSTTGEPPVPSNVAHRNTGFDSIIAAVGLAAFAVI